MVNAINIEVTNDATHPQSLPFIPGRFRIN